MNIEIRGKATWDFAIEIEGMFRDDFNDLEQWEQDELIAEYLTQRDGGINYTLTPGTEEFDVQDVIEARP